MYLTETETIWLLDITTVSVSVDSEDAEGLRLDLTIFSMTSPGTALLFTPETDCVLVGDSEGQVPVYEPKNLPDGGSTQMEKLEDVIRSTLSSQHTLGKTDGDTYCRRVRLFVLTSPSS